MSPPAVARAIVAITVPPSDFESICGDLQEEYVRRIGRDGQPVADNWYWSQAIRSAPSLLSYSRAPRSFSSSFLTLLIVSASIVALLWLNELIDDAIGAAYHMIPGPAAWPFFLTGCTIAAAFGAIIAALRRSYGMRLILFSAFGLLVFIATPILLQFSSRLTSATWILIVSAAMSMCIGGAAYHFISRYSYDQKLT